MTTRAVVLGGGAGGARAANLLAQQAPQGTEVILVERTGTHLFQPGLVQVLFGEAGIGSYRRPLSGLLAPGVKLVVGEVESLDLPVRLVKGSFGELAYDELVVALGVEAASGALEGLEELSPWTVPGALAGREALSKAGPRTRVIVGVAGIPYRCPPAVFDLAVRLRARTGAEVELFHPWDAPLAPFGEQVSGAFSALLSAAGVTYHGGFRLVSCVDGCATASDGRELRFDMALVVPPHKPPRAVSSSELAGEGGWPEVTYPSLTSPRFAEVSVLGDLAAVALGAGMAGTLALSEAGHVAGRLAAKLSGGVPPRSPQMSALCFVDTGITASALACDFTAPAAKAGPPSCVLLPFMSYFRRAKQLFAEEWFSALGGGAVPQLSPDAQAT